MKTFSLLLVLLAVSFSGIVLAQTTLQTFNSSQNGRILGPYVPIGINLQQNDTLTIYKNGQSVSNTTLSCSSVTGCTMTVKIEGITN